MISPNIFDLTVYHLVQCMQRGSGNECGFYVAYHMIRLTATFKNLKGAKVSLSQMFIYIYIHTHGTYTLWPAIEYPILQPVHPTVVIERSSPEVPLPSGTGGASR